MIASRSSLRYPTPTGPLGTMDDELYDEFGNYIGPGLADSSEVRLSALGAGGGRSTMDDGPMM